MREERGIFVIPRDILWNYGKVAKKVVKKESLQNKWQGAVLIARLSEHKLFPPLFFFPRVGVGSRTSGRVVNKKINSR